MCSDACCDAVHDKQIVIVTIQVPLLFDKLSSMTATMKT